jgi:DNA polymerase-4
MPAARARRLCPDGVFLAPDFAHYREASREVMAIVRDVVEQVEVVGLDEAYLELTGVADPEGMRAMRTRIERVTELTCSIGIGPNKLVAKVASDAEKPRGFVALSREQACIRFADAPVGLLPGIGPKTADRLRAAGIDTVAKLAAAPRTVLAGRFGPRFGGELQRRARFDDDAPVTQQRKVVSESREMTFDHDVADPARLEGVLEDLVQRLCKALLDQRRRGRTVGIKVRLDDFSTHTRARTLVDPVASAEAVAPVALELLRRFAPSRPVRLLGVRVAGLEQVEPPAQLKLVV